MGKPGTWLGLKSWGGDLCWMLRHCLLVLLECPSLARSGKACLCLPWNPLLCLCCGVIHGVHFGWVFVFPVQAQELGKVHRKDTSSVNNSPAFCNMQCTKVSNNGHRCSLRHSLCEEFPPGCTANSHSPKGAGVLLGPLHGRLLGHLKTSSNDTKSVQLFQSWKGINNSYSVKGDVLNQD